MAGTGNLGGLIVTLGLDAVQFFTGLTKAEQSAKKFADSLEKDINKGLKLSKQGFTVMTAAAAAAAVALDHLITTAADFKDLEEKTGTAAETLASYTTAAAVAGTTTADIGTALNKLEKNLGGVDDESKAAGAALQALGLNIKDFKNLKPEERVDALAKAFGSFADTPAKAAAAIALFGKAGAELLPFLKEVEQGVGRQRILTQEQIEAADAYSDRNKALTATLKQYAQVIAVEAIPALNAVVEAGVKVVQGLVGIDDKTDRLTRDKKLTQFGKDVGDAAILAAKGMAIFVESIGFVVSAGYAFSQSIAVMVADLNVLDKAVSAPKAKPFGTLGFSPEEAAKANKELDDALAERNATLARANKAYDNLFNGNKTPLSDAIDAMASKMRSGPAGAAQGNLFSDRAWSAAQDRLKKKPPLKFDGAVDKEGAERIAKAAFEAVLKEQERYIKRAQDLQKDQEQDLKGQYDLELVGFRRYNEERLSILDSTTSQVLAAYDKEIAAAEKFKNRPGQKEDDRINNEQKYLDLIEKRDDFERDSARTRKDIQLDAQKALRDYGDSVDEVKAKVAELSGNLEEAARIRFDTQNRSLRAAFRNEGDTASQERVDFLEKQQLAQERVNEAERDYGFISERLSIEQQKIENATRAGTQTSIEAINKRSELAQRYSQILSAQLEIEKAAAQDLTGPARLKAELGIARLEQEIEALQISAHELENTFRETFVDALSTHLAAAIDRTESLSKAFKGMVRDISSSITRLASHNIAEAIFGKSGVGGSIPGLLAGIFGGGGTPGTAEPVQLAGPTEPSGGIFSSLFSGLSSLFGGFFAEGGTVSANKPIVVGEHGPEVYQPFAAGNIISNEELSARRSRKYGDINISITVPGSTNSSTADQIALRTAARLRAVTAKDG